ncbi:hypothetical protein HPB48_010602 [Haemaphysalis longicornis]|uniref:SWIM-type domain-containing protein n=1 Tax=Haemaphysalis longicornis TaxID=44386 RepID=A0A9J6FV76_HAELO|nr:hypothetical protein HPB48_010602 [Haemaphysalis longicornis]
MSAKSATEDVAGTSTMSNGAFDAPGKILPTLQPRARETASSTEAARPATGESADRARHQLRRAQTGTPKGSCAEDQAAQRCFLGLDDRWRTRPVAPPPESSLAAVRVATVIWQPAPTGPFASGWHPRSMSSAARSEASSSQRRHGRAHHHGERRGAGGPRRNRRTPAAPAPYLGEPRQARRDQHGGLLPPAVEIRPPWPPHTVATWVSQASNEPLRGYFSATAWSGQSSARWACRWTGCPRCSGAERWRSTAPRSRAAWRLRTRGPATAPFAASSWWLPHTTSIGAAQGRCRSRQGGQGGGSGTTKNTVRAQMRAHLAFVAATLALAAAEAWSCRFRSSSGGGVGRRPGTWRCLRCRVGVAVGRSRGVEPHGRGWSSWPGRGGRPLGPGGGAYSRRVRVSSCPRLCTRRNGRFLLKARCYRGLKKTKAPHIVHATVNEVSQVADGSCECPAAKRFCSHLQAVLNTIILLQQKRYSEEAPEHLSCTDLPQRWRRPRDKAMKARSIQDLEWRRAGEGGQQMPSLSRLDLSKPSERSVNHKRKAITQLADSMRA